MRPAASPSVSTTPSPTAAEARSTTSSPSSRNVRVAAAHRQRFGPAAGPLDQAALAARRGARHGAGGEQVAGAQVGAVHGQMGDLLRDPPVQPGERRAAAHGLGGRGPGGAQVDRQAEVEGPVLARPQVRQRRRVLHRTGRPARAEGVERGHPRRHRRGERLAEERPERLVLPRLDVAGRPVVHQHQAEHVVHRLVDRHRAPGLGGHADHRAHLELDVEPLRSGRTPPRRRPGAGRTAGGTAVPDTTTVPARP